MKMPEEQNIVAEQWNSRLSRFLGSVISWKQLGESNNDIYCEDLKKKVGIDGVFAYRRNAYTPQQVVFVEAKTIAKIDSLNRSKIEDWVNVFVDKIVHAPHSQEFFNKFQPDSNANYGLGLIGLWVRDTEKYTEEKIRNWLSQINVPARRQNPVNLFFVSNRVLSSISTIFQTIQDLRQKDNYISIEPHFPAYGDFPVSDGKSWPIETLVSKFAFYKVRKKQFLINEGHKHHEYDSSIVFYTGKLDNYEDLRFVGLALRQFQILGPEIEIYTQASPTSIRNEIKVFKDEFASGTNSEFKFNELTISNDLPGWL